MKNIEKDSESISFSITGVGTITVKVFVNDVKKKSGETNELKFFRNILES